MQRTLLILTILIMIAGVAWFVLYSGDAGVATITIDDLIKMTKEGEFVPDVLEKLPEEKKAEDLEALAFKIINRPILIKDSLSEDNKKQITEKINELAEAIKEHYDEIYYWFDLGGYRKIIGDYEGAIEAWDFAGVIRPKNHVSFHNLGDLYGFYLKDYKEAEQNFLKSIINEPINIDAYLQLATLYEYNYTKKIGEIENLLLVGIKFNPSNSDLKIALGEYYQKAGKMSEALVYFEEALALDPANKALKEEIENLKNR